MSAKQSKKGARPAPAEPAPATPAIVPSASSVAATATEAPWIESANPRRRALGKAALAGVWLYIAALWLLALDQTFNWGIFGPKIPPLP